MRFKTSNAMILVLIIVLVFSIQCTTQQDDPAKLLEEITAANKVFMETFKDGDAAVLASLYTEDGKVLPPNAGIVEGKEAMQAFWQTVIDMGVKEVVLEIVEVEGHGDTAIEVSKFKMKDTNGNELDHGKYIVIWKRVEGNWKVHYDIVNSSVPAQQ